MSFLMGYSTEGPSLTPAGGGRAPLHFAIASATCHNLPSRTYDKVVDDHDRPGLSPTLLFTCRTARSDAGSSCRWPRWTSRTATSCITGPIPAGAVSGTARFHPSDGSRNDPRREASHYRTQETFRLDAPRTLHRACRRSGPWSVAGSASIPKSRCWWSVTPRSRWSSLKAARGHRGAPERRNGAGHARGVQVLGHWDEGARARGAAPPEGPLQRPSPKSLGGLALEQLLKRQEDAAILSRNVEYCETVRVETFMRLHKLNRRGKQGQPASAAPRSGSCLPPQTASLDC
jgi:hypothetical protein